MYTSEQGIVKYAEALGWAAVVEDSGCPMIKWLYVFKMHDKISKVIKVSLMSDFVCMQLSEY